MNKNTRRAHGDHTPSSTPCEAGEETAFDAHLAATTTTKKSERQIVQLEKDARRNWDLFYKRNTKNFFRDRHYIHREFAEIHEPSPSAAAAATTNETTTAVVTASLASLSTDNGARKRLIGIGCGVGNTIFPLMYDEPHLDFYACDFSPRAVGFVDERYGELKAAWTAHGVAYHAAAAAESSGGGDNAVDDVDVDGSSDGSVPMQTDDDVAETDNTAAAAADATADVAADAAADAATADKAAASDKPLPHRARPHPSTLFPTPPRPCPSLNTGVVDIVNEPFPDNFPPSKSRFAPLFRCSLFASLVVLCLLRSSSPDNFTRVRYGCCPLFALSTLSLLFFFGFVFAEQVICKQRIANKKRNSNVAIRFVVLCFLLHCFASFYLFRYTLLSLFCICCRRAHKCSFPIIIIVCYNATVHFGILLFVLSAVAPDKHAQTLCNIFDLMAPGGVLYFRDYALYDMTQLRFKKGSCLGERYYARADGTRSFFFTTELLTELMLRASFELVECVYHRKNVENVKLNLNMRRVWIQGKFRRPM
jgi:methyltransferase-like protein 6